jgi:hypothetical protein
VLFRSNTDVTIRPDKFSVPALQPDHKSQATFFSTLVNAGILTPNEARLGLRFEKLEGLDEIRIPQNITGIATRPDSAVRALSPDTNPNN